MITDWTLLAKKLGSIKEDGSESGSTAYAKLALEEILGEEWIYNTVDFIMTYRPGRELALNCLVDLETEKAAQYAYQIYKNNKGEIRQDAVWLIGKIAHPASFQWVEEFLNDPEVLSWGLGLLDQLLWTEKIQPDNRTEDLLDLAMLNSEGALAKNVAFIREYLERRKSLLT